MAFPTVAARTESALTTAGTTWTPTFTQATGNLVIIMFSLNAAAAQALSSVGDSFVNLTNRTGNAHVVYKVLDGSEGGNVAITVASNAKFCGAIWQIAAGTFDPAQAPEIAAVATQGEGAGGNAPNSGTITAPWGSDDNLFISFFHQNGEELDDDTWCTSAPTNYGNLTQSTTGTAGGSTTNSQLAAADRFLAAATDDPGAFATAQDRATQCFTLVIKPVSAGGGGNRRRRFFMAAG